MFPKADKTVYNEPNNEFRKIFSVVWKIVLLANAIVTLRFNKQAMPIHF